MISVFRHGTNDILVLPERYAAQIGGNVRTFRNKSSIPSSKVMECNKIGRNSWTALPLNTGRTGYPVTTTYLRCTASQNNEELKHAKSKGHDPAPSGDTEDNHYRLRFSR